MTKDRAAETLNAPTPKPPPKGATPLRNLRVEDELWAAAKVAAADADTTISEVMRDALARLIEERQAAAELAPAD